MSRSSKRSRKGSTARRAAPGGVLLKSPDEIDAMAAAGSLLARCHAAVEAEVVAGVTTARLDELAETFMRDHGAIPAFKGYNGFPGTICPSVNEEVVHAIPGARALNDGDILSLDMGLVLDGWVADQARTLPVGEISAEAKRLLAATAASLADGIAAIRPDGRVGDISEAVQRRVEGAGFHVVEALVGHGVGRSMHEPPQVPNFGRAGTGASLAVGTVIAIEPMVNVGTADIRMADDGWTISSADGKLSAHFEHTVAVTESGPRILTLA